MGDAGCEGFAPVRRKRLPDLNARPLLSPPRRVGLLRAEGAAVPAVDGGSSEPRWFAWRSAL